jgi:glycosidase
VDLNQDNLKMRIFGRSVWKFGLLLCALFLCALPAARADRDVSRAAARTSPQWLRDGVIYEVFPRDFSAAGDLNGVTAKLEDLHRLGVTIVWLMPVHPIGDKCRKGAFGSPYSISDYYAITPDYGTLDDLKRLVAEAHKRGMKVIMDIVANHTAWDSVMMAHPEFYKRDAKGKPLPPVPEWSDVAGLDYGNPQLREYMIAMMKHWIKECDVDGFRCDVAYMVPTDFWEQARAELQKEKPDIMLLAEASKPELLVKAFDIDYSWPLLATLNRVLVQGAPANEIRRSWEETRGENPQGALHMRITDDHDEPRAVARFGIRGALAGSALMFTLDGVPLLYNGMEVGDATESGDPALFEKLPIFWHPRDRPQVWETYQNLISLRKQFSALREGQVVWLPNSDGLSLVTFMRSDDKDEFVIAINFSNRPLSGTIDVKNAGDFKPVRISGMPASSADVFPRLSLNGFEWRIYHRTIAK